MGRGGNSEREREDNHTSRHVNIKRASIFCFCFIVFLGTSLYITYVYQRDVGFNSSANTQRRNRILRQQP